MFEFTLFAHETVKPSAAIYNPCVYGPWWPGCNEPE